MTTFPRFWALLGHIALILLRLALPVGLELAFFLFSRFLFSSDPEAFAFDPDVPADAAFGAALLLMYAAMLWCGVILVQIGMSIVRLLRWWKAQSAGNDAKMRATAAALHSPFAWMCTGMACFVVVMLNAIILSPSSRSAATPLPKQDVSPTDEEMIAHFQANRETFEELVRYYRTRLFVGRDEYITQRYYWVEREGWPPKTQKAQMDTLMRRAGVRRISPDLNGYRWWPGQDDPDAESKWKASREQCLGDDPANRQVVCDLKGPQYEELEIVPERSADFGKCWVHFPEAPKVEDGYLLPPGYRPGANRGHRRVYDSLNVTPPYWYAGRCAYRAIDAHWFLRMCRPYTYKGG